MANRLPKVISIVLTWNSADFIEECLLSLQNSSFKTEILVIDNDSSDNTRELIAKKFPGIELINSGANLGYAGGNNLGIKHVLPKKPDYIFILNPDAQVETSSIERMVDRMETNQRLAAVSPMIYYHNTKKILFAGSYINWRTGEAPHIGLDELDSGQYDNVTATERVNGCAMLLRTETLKSVGLMDERYFLYYEELDLSVRMKAAGFEMGIVPKAKVWHLKSLSTGGYFSPLSQYYQTRNRLLFMHKFRPHYKAFRLESYLLASRRVWTTFRRASPRQAVVLIGVLRKAYRDFSKQKFGKQEYS